MILDRSTSSSRRLSPKGKASKVAVEECELLADGTARLTLRGATDHVETDMAAGIPAEAREALLQQVPLKRVGAAREVAEVVRFLAGDGAAYVTGQTIHVNGGLYM